MRYLRITKWDEYQHYGDRCPPWIKLHQDMLTSRTWVTLDDPNRVAMVALMLIAAGSNNLIPFDPVFIKRRAYLDSDPDFDLLISLGFIELCDDEGEALAVDSDCKQGLSQSYSLSVSSSVKTSKKRANLSAGFEEWWSAYPKKVKKQAALAIWKRKRFHERADELLAKITEQAAKCSRFADPQFIPHPTTYLNQGQYEDDIQPRNSANGTTHISEAPQKSEPLDEAFWEQYEQRRQAQ